jgi:hypothetical protein
MSWMQFSVGVTVKLFCVQEQPPGEHDMAPSASATAMGVSRRRRRREVLGPIQSSLLVFASALSWIPLLINHVGTSHASDLLIVPLLLWAAVRVTSRPTRPAALALALAIVLSGGFRLTTFIMMGPLLLAVLWVNRRKPNVWLACAVGALLLLLLQLLVIHATGGWATYLGWAAKMNTVNRANCVIHSGFTRLTLFNLSRSLIWFGLATIGLWVSPFRLRSLRPWTPKQRVLFVYGASAIAGPVAVCALYLCEHPGYLAPALAGCYLCVAVAWDRAEARPGFAKWPIAAIAVTLLLFFGMRYYREPVTRSQALANSLLLQFSADGARHAFYLTSSDWLSAAEGKSP